MSEDEYLATVERIQQAMAIEPFQPSVIDVVKLLSDWRDWSRENERLRADNALASNELVELAHLYAATTAQDQEIERLRTFKQQIIEVYGGNYEPEGRLADLTEVIERELASNKQG